MNQSQSGNPFGRLIEFARPYKTGYIVSAVLAVLGVAFGIVPYFATARMTIELLSGNRDLSFYMVWCLISGGCFARCAAGKPTAIAAPMKQPLKCCPRQGGKLLQNLPECLWAIFSILRPGN